MSNVSGPLKGPIISGEISVLRIITTLLLCVLAPLAVGDAHWASWSDKTLCRLVGDTGLDEYRQAASDRGLSCRTDKAKNRGNVIAKTNIKGLVINKFRCFQGSYYVGNIVNNTDQHITDVLIQSFDYDGALMGSCRTFKGLSPASKDSFLAFNCNCKGSNKYQIEAR